MPEKTTPSGIIYNDAALERGSRFRNDGTTLSSQSLGLQYGSGNQLYSGAAMTNTTADFTGDFRSVDSWQRLDLYPVRMRSRQLERGDGMCKAYKRNMINNVLGHKGFHQKFLSATAKIYGDNSDGVPDDFANGLIQTGLEKQGREENLTTRKRLSRRELDALLLSRLIFDGEFILMKRPGFKNDCNFAWQPINADYLDHNLNRLEDGRDQDGVQVAEPGNMTRMGVELDKTDKFPVAHWFLVQRPNETQYNYQEPSRYRYVRVPADQVIHVFVQTEDEEQTRGFPWVFAAMINLWRSGRFQEAALVNATIGASKGMFYKKMYPEGFIANGGDTASLDKTDCGYLVDKVQPGMATELPWGVEPVPVEYKYPDAQIKEFLMAMNMGMALTFGTSYATTTGDLSNANFVSSRLGQLEEREQYMAVQEFMIQKWKLPAAEEELYRGMLSRNIPLPLSKIDKFNKFAFVGRRWPFVQPVDDLNAKLLALDNNLTSISAIIEETTQSSAEDMFKQIAADNDLMSKYKLYRVHNAYQPVDPKNDGSVQPSASSASSGGNERADTPDQQSTGNDDEHDPNIK